jgi:flagellar motor switch protein FliN/FliY
VIHDAAAASLSQPAEYVRCWAENLSQLLAQIAGSPLPCAVRTTNPSAAPVPAGESDLWIVGLTSGGLRGEMCLRLSAASTLGLAQRFMSQPPDAQAELTPEHRDAAIELMRQVGGQVATALKPQWGEVHWHLESVPTAPSWPASSTLWIQAGNAAPEPLAIEVSLSAALVAALRVETPATENCAAAPALAAGKNKPDGQPSLDLLMSVDLAVTLRFGSRRLLLREVLELDPGTVVELDRQVNEPIDLLLDGRTVARGEIVLVNGNYGLRVTEVAAAAVA